MQCLSCRIHFTSWLSHLLCYPHIVSIIDSNIAVIQSYPRSDKSHHGSISISYCTYSRANYAPIICLSVVSSNFSYRRSLLWRCDCLSVWDLLQFNLVGSLHN